MGFTKGRSTESAISETADYIEQHLFHDKHCLGVFLDISSAFDSISIDHIRDSLLAHNGDPDLVEWYHSYLGRRFLEITLHGENSQLTTSTGFPQGGVCSARFWLIAFDEAIRIINSEGIVGNGYADDCGALLGGTHSGNMIDKMQAMLSRLVTWGHSCGLRFNPQKTVVILFTRATKTFNRRVRMEGILLPYSDEVVYLGVTLDKALTWTPHILNKLNKARGLLHKMASITHSYWGPQPKLMRWMYTGIVRPVVSYAAMTWAHKIEDEDTIEDMRRLNRMAINTMVKIPRSTPTRGLEIILDILPLHLHVRQEGLAAYNRLRPTITWEGVFQNQTNSVSHLRYWQYLTQDVGMQDFHVETDNCHVLRPDLRFHVITDSLTNMSEHQTPADCNVYTDGSKIDGHVGAGVFIEQDGNPVIKDKFRLPDCSTVYQAEVTAVREAAAILTTFHNLTTVKIYVDSQAVLSSFLSTFVKSKLVLQTITTLNSIIAEDISFVWTKAHVGTKGNEIADTLAKEGASLPQSLAIPTPPSHIKFNVRKITQNIWNKEWHTYPDARQTKIYHPQLDKHKSNTIIQWPRLKLGRYIRAVTGHNNLLYHLSNMDPNISPLCRFCLQANEEFHHLASDCPPLWWERHYISAQQPDHVHDWTVHQIATFAFLPPIDAALVKPLYLIESLQNRIPEDDAARTQSDDPTSDSDMDIDNNSNSSSDTATSTTPSSDPDNQSIDIDTSHEHIQ